MEFDQAVGIVLSHEGGFVDHPSDPGGVTRYGITQRVAAKHGYRGGMQFFPLEQAKLIYKVDYWVPTRCEVLPAPLRLHVFDAAVNSGVSRAVRWLQEALGVPEDGVPGPVTVGAAMSHPDPQALAMKMVGHRLAFLTDLSTWAVFGKGWARRIAGNLQRS